MKKLFYDIGEFMYRRPTECSSEVDFSANEVELACKDPIFREKISIASPALVEMMDIYMKTPEQLSDKKLIGLNISIMKYLARSKERTTPFGLFSGVGIGCFSENEKFPYLKVKNEKKINVDSEWLFGLIEHMEKGKRYDIIYLDIEMTKQNGIDAAWNIRKLDKKVLIIYVTSHESFAKEVFEVSAFRFITKPIEPKIFEKYFKDAENEIVRRPKYFQYQYNKISYRLPIEDIIYFQSDRRVTYIITNDGSKKCYGKLNDIEKHLVESDTYFYRTHQSFLVNPKYVTAYFYDSMELADGTTLSISENRRKRVSELFCMLKGEDIIV